MRTRLLLGGLITGCVASALIIGSTGTFIEKDEVLAMIDQISRDHDVMIDQGYIERAQSLVPMGDMFGDGLRKNLLPPVDITNLPDEVDLRDKATSIKNQGDEGTCTAFGLTAVQEMAHCLAGKCGLDLSERQRWNYYRQYSALSALSTINKGIGEERYCPYQNKECYPVAQQKAHHKITTYEMLPTISHVLQALANRMPVYFWSQTPQQMVSCNSTINRATMVDGGHAYAVVGYYRKSDPVLIVKNSWGEDCGDNGYQYMAAKIFDKNGYWDAAAIRGASIDKHIDDCRTECEKKWNIKHFWERRTYCKQVCI